MLSQKTTSKEIALPEKMSVFVDKKTKARTIALPLEFPDGSHGAVMLCRVKNSDWNPGEMIKSVTINFYEDSTV